MLQALATIIGGKGFIGSHLHTKLLACGWDCHTPDRQAIYDNKKDMGHVFYCAGLTADYIQRPFDAVEAHVSLLSRILQNCAFQSLTYLSSTRLYDSQPGTIASEDMPLLLNPGNSRHIYDLSKALGESLCLVMGKGRARVARLSCVYNDHTDTDGFLPDLLQHIIIKRPSLLKIDTSPHYKRDYIHLQDVLEALILIATKGNNLIYNVASGENISNEILFSTLTKISGCKIQALSHDTPTIPCKIDISRMQNEFNWHPVSVLKKITAILKEITKC